MGYLMAVRGYDGQLLWKLTIRSEVFLMNCEDFDIDQDGKPDCIGTGRQGCVVAFNPYEGKRKNYLSRVMLKKCYKYLLIANSQASIMRISAFI